MESGWAGLEASGDEKAYYATNSLALHTFLRKTLFQLPRGENWQANSYKPNVPIKQVSTTTCSIITLPNLS